MENEVDSNLKLEDFLIIDAATGELKCNVEGSGCTQTFKVRCSNNLVGIGKND